jgi:hypothetical protein
LSPPKDQQNSQGDCGSEGSQINSLGVNSEEGAVFDKDSDGGAKQGGTHLSNFSLKY